MSKTSARSQMAREPEAAASPDKLLRSAAVKSRLGDISSQTLWRFSRDPELGFPKALTISGVRYWRTSAIEEFIEQRQQAAA